MQSVLDDGDAAQVLWLCLADKLIAAFVNSFQIAVHI